MVIRCKTYPAKCLSEYQALCLICPYSIQQDQEHVDNNYNRSLNEHVTCAFNAIGVNTSQGYSNTIFRISRSKPIKDTHNSCIATNIRNTHGISVTHSWVRIDIFQSKLTRILMNTKKVRELA